MLWINGFGYIAWGKSIAGVASLDAISTCSGGQETAMVVYRYDYFCVIRKSEK
jgi:hypothetical protein